MGEINSGELIPLSLLLVGRARLAGLGVCCRARQIGRLRLGLVGARGGRPLGPLVRGGLTRGGQLLLPVGEVSAVFGAVDKARGRRGTVAQVLPVLVFDQNLRLGSDAVFAEGGGAHLAPEEEAHCGPGFAAI